MHRIDRRVRTILLITALLASGCADQARHGFERVLSVMGQATMSGRVTNSSGTGIQDATVSVIDAGTGTTVGSAVTNSAGDYSLTVPDGTYTVRVTGGGFGETTLLNVSIVGLKTQNFILISGNVGLTGRLLGPAGDPIANASVTLASTTSQSTTTAADGSFSFATPTGSYQIQFSASNRQPPLPTNFYFYVSNFVLNADRVQDFTVPARTATFVVTDEASAPVAGVQLSVNCQYMAQFSMAAGLTANGYMCSSGRSTNAQGIVTTGMVPMQNEISFRFVPPSVSGLGTTAVPIRPLANDTTIAIVLEAAQYSKLQDANGNGYANHTVTAYTTGGVLAGQSSTLPDGRFAISLPNGTYRLQISGNDGTRTLGLNLYNYPITTGVVPDITIPKITFTVNVQAPDGSVVPGARIAGGCFYPGFDIPVPDGVTTQSSYYCPSATAGSDGKIKLNLPPTEAATTHSVLPPANSSYGSAEVTLPLSATDYETTVTLPAGISWTGTVSNAQGEDVPRTNFSMYSANFQQFIKSTQANLEGAFDIVTSAGTFAFQLSGSSNNGAAPYNYNLQTTSGYTISEAVTQDLTFPTLYLTVTVLDASGRGVQNVVVGDVWVGGVQFTAFTGFTLRGSMFPRALTDADGIARVAMFGSSQPFDLPIKPPAGSKLAPTSVRIQPMTSDASLAVVAPPLNTTPVAHIAAIASAAEPATITLDASGSSDEDGDALTYQWSFSDGATRTGMTVTRDYDDNAEHEVTLTVNDGKGGLATARANITVTNVDPTATLVAPTTDVTAGSMFEIALTNGADASPVDAASLTYAFDCGAGYGDFSAASTAECNVENAGPVTVKGTIRDKDGGSTEYSATVTIVERQAPQTIAFDALANRTYGDGPIALAASATSELPVSFAAVGDCTVSGSELTITGAGSCTVTASQAGDANWLPAEPVEQSFAIAKAVITATADNLEMVYADPLPTLTSTFSGFQNGDNASVVGGALQLTTTASSSSAAGTYPIVVDVSGLTADNYTFAAVNGVLTVTKRRADVDYTGDSYALTAGTKVTQATVRLAAHVSRVSGGAGDLSLARVSFLLFADNNTSSTPNLRFDDVAVSSTGDALLQTSVPEGTWTVAVEIPAGNGYWRTAASTDGVLTIAIPPGDRSITGGGWVNAGLSAIGKTHFGFTIATAKNGNIKGNATITFRDTDGYAYRVKSTSMQSATFKINNIAGRASFVSRANVQIIDPSTGEVVGTRGNQMITVDVQDGDAGKPKSADRIAIEIRDTDGSTWKQLGSYTALSLLGNGNIDVKSK